MRKKCQHPTILMPYPRYHDQYWHKKKNTFGILQILKLHHSHTPCLKNNPFTLKSSVHNQQNQE